MLLSSGDNVPPYLSVVLADQKKGKDSSIYIKPQMIDVAGGQFQMGDSTRPEGEEKPEHTVILSSFQICKYEVTVGEFRKFMNSHTYVTDAEKDGFSYVFDGENLIYRKDSVNWRHDVWGDLRVNEENHPVLHVSRNDAEAFCKWLSKVSGKNYRLATEAEWEYAAKGGPLHEGFLYSGADYMGSIGWYAYNSELHTHPVGTKKPNGLGIYDMSGNAWEWCSDWYGGYTADTQTNPSGPTSGIEGVLRGGGWRFFPNRQRCTARRNCLPSFNGSGIGFRIAASK